MFNKYFWPIDFVKNFPFLVKLIVFKLCALHVAQYILETIAARGHDVTDIQQGLF